MSQTILQCTVKRLWVHPLRTETWITLLHNWSDFGMCRTRSRKFYGPPYGSGLHPSFKLQTALRRCSPDGFIFTSIDPLRPYLIQLCKESYMRFYYHIHSAFSISFWNTTIRVCECSLKCLKFLRFTLPVSINVIRQNYQRQVFLPSIKPKLSK